MQACSGLHCWGLLQDSWTSPIETSNAPIAADAEILSNEVTVRRGASRTDCAVCRAADGPYQAKSSFGSDIIA
jgi:hypothetical protein